MRLAGGGRCPRRPWWAPKAAAAAAALKPGGNPEGAAEVGGAIADATIDAVAAAIGGDGAENTDDVGEFEWKDAIVSQTGGMV
jgi:hypothetical protein